MDSYKDSYTYKKSVTPRYLIHQLLLHDSSWLIIDEMSGKIIKALMTKGSV